MGRVTEALWVIGGQAATAIGTIVGVRVLTQYLHPEAYGTVSLCAGLSALAISIAATPLTQAAIHFYPAAAASGTITSLVASLARCFRRIAPAIAVLAALAAAVCSWVGSVNPLLVGLVVALLACDCWRSANLSLLNAARRQARCAIWMASDAWLRPLAATAAVMALGQSAAVVLVAYAGVSLCLTYSFSRERWDRPAMGQVTAEVESGARELDRRMWRYAIPLIPLGVLGWASNLGDRYVIGGLVSVGATGIYAAVYGVSSSPFMIAGGTAEQALRPIYQTAVSSANTERAAWLLRIWIGSVALVCAVGAILFLVEHDRIASILVGSRFRSGAALMPWIAFGYALRAVSYVFERVCYAHGRTDRVLAIQLCAAGVTAVATPAGVMLRGLQGAAMAVPIYFAVQAVVAAFLARRTLRDRAHYVARELTSTAVAS